MFNILVVDSIENELNHLIFMLEDYKATNTDFDKILNIIDANNETDANKILQTEKIHILFVSSDFDKIAFDTYKQNRDLLIVSVSKERQRLKKWYTDQLIKPFKSEFFNLRLRSYLDILIYKRIDISDFERKIIYDLSLVSNLYLFWENYSNARRTNQHEIVQAIYSLALSQIDRGISSKITVTENNEFLAFQLETRFNPEFVFELKQIQKICNFYVNENMIEFEVNLISNENEKLDEYEDFALEYLNYDRLEILNNFVSEHNVIEDEALIEEFEYKISSANDFSREDIKNYIRRKRGQSNKRYIFMDQVDMKIFEDLLVKFKEALYNSNKNTKENISIDSLEIIVHLFADLSQILSIYPMAKAVTKGLDDMGERLLSQGRHISEIGKEAVVCLEDVFISLSLWHEHLSKREDLSFDLINDHLFNSFEMAKNKLFNC